MLWFFVTVCFLAVLTPLFIWSLDGFSGDKKK